MGYQADKSPLIGHLAGPTRRLEPLGAQRQEKGGSNHLIREGLHATTPRAAARLRSLRSPSEAPASCRLPLDIAHSPSRRRLSKEIVGRGTPCGEARWVVRLHTNTRSAWAVTTFFATHPASPRFPTRIHPAASSAERSRLSAPSAAWHPRRSGRRTLLLQR